MAPHDSPWSWIKHSHADFSLYCKHFVLFYLKHYLMFVLDENKKKDEKICLVVHVSGI